MGGSEKARPSPLPQCPSSCHLLTQDSGLFSTSSSVSACIPSLLPLIRFPMNLPSAFSSQNLCLWDLEIRLFLNYE